MSLPTSLPPAPAPSLRRELVAHLVWEAVLVVAVLACLVLVIATGDLPLRLVWPQVASLGLVACGLALSLRTATPNLLLGPAGLLAGWIYVELVGHGTAGGLAGLVAIAATTAYGVVVALVDALLGAPTWMLTLGAGLLVQGVFYSRQDGQALRLEGGPTGPDSAVWIAWTLVLVVLSVGGGALWMAGGRRSRGLGARRDTTGPAAVGPASIAGSLVGVGGSTLLYAVGGVLVVQQVGALAPGGDRLLPALGVVLLGGVGAWGRRGGLAGTVLATLVVVLLGLAGQQQGLGFWVTALLLPGIVILVGLALSRVLEAVVPDAVPEQPQEPGPRVVQVG